MSSKLKVVLAFLLVAGGTFAILELFVSSSKVSKPPAEEPATAPDAGASGAGPTDRTAAVEQPSVPQPAAAVEPEPPPLRKLMTHRKAPAVPVAGSKPELKAVLTVKDTTPPRISILAPVDRSYTLERTINLTVRSEAGARVELDGAALTEKSPGFFGGSTRLSVGKNHIIIQASDAVGNTSSASALVSYIDPATVRAEKSRLVALLKELDEVRAVARDVDGRIADLLEKLEDAKDANSITEFSRILREVRNNRKQLQNEIENAIVKIDKFLPAAK